MNVSQTPPLWPAAWRSLVGLTTLVALAVTVAPSSATEMGAAPPKPADDPVVQEPSLPVILSSTDEVRYRSIFRLQKAGHWRKADREIAKLGDRVLIGHVMAERYLHATRYRSRYKEISAWLKRYADHPQARRMYELAKKRRPKSAAWPRRPSSSPFPVYDRDTTASTRYRSPKYRTGSQRRRASRTMWQLKRFSRTKRFSLAQRYLTNKRVQKLLDRVEMDISYARLGAGWFHFGNAHKAYKFTTPAAGRSGDHYPDAYWYGGLAAFQTGQFVEAANYFESMATKPSLSSWEKSASAFWAARSNMRGRRPERVHRWLKAAAEHPRTFYGLLARRLLGNEITFAWNIPELTPALTKSVLRRPSGRRALALIQIDQDRLAERELRHVSIHRDPKLGAALLAVAEIAQLPALALRAARHAPVRGGGLSYGALYPVPQWQPDGGFKIDRAVVFAFMRQESGFNTRAKSHAGARGLMQLMPATAGYIARKRFRGRRRNQLYDPEYNMALGQKYLNYLLAHQTVGRNLIMLAAAYNGGPGNLKKWRTRANASNYDDALVFIESIPSYETRNFVQRVLSNLWIYRARLGQPAPSLDLLAAGERPIYESLDGKTERVALNVRDRR